MPATPNNAQEAQSQLDAWKAEMSPEDYSRSKKVNKVVNYLKSLNPGNFDTEAGGGLDAQIQRGVEDPTPELPAGGAGFGGAGFGGGSTGFGSGSGSSSGELNLQNIYDEASNTPEIQGLQTELESKKTALTTALTGINDNPFYSEATRTGRIAKLNEQAGREIRDIEDMLNTRKADAQVKVNIATQQYNIDDKNYQRNLGKLNLLISSGAILNASASDISQIALATGISTDMIKGIISATEKAQQNLQIATNDAGDVTIYDLNTGNVVNTVAGIGNQKNTPKDTTSEIKPYVTGATKIFKDVNEVANETNPNATKDKLLSAGEQDMIMRRLIGLVSGDEELANKLFQHIWDIEGFDNFYEGQ